MMPSTPTFTGVHYRERIGPPLWLIIAAAVVAPMAALVVIRVSSGVALLTGLLVAILVVALLFAAAPVIKVVGHELLVGRARIDVAYLGTPHAFTGADAHHERGVGLDRRAWHQLRGGVDGVVVVPVIDQEDPTPAWVFSSRTPERIAAAIVRAQAIPHTPYR